MRKEKVKNASKIVDMTIKKEVEAAADDHLSVKVEPSSPAPSTRQYHHHHHHAGASNIADVVPVISSASTLLAASTYIHLQQAAADELLSTPTARANNGGLDGRKTPPSASSTMTTAGGGALNVTAGTVIGFDGLLGVDDDGTTNSNNNNNNNNNNKVMGYAASNNNTGSNSSSSKSNNNNESLLLLMWCAGCGCKIEERYFLHAADRHWHCSCLKCCVCGLALDGYLTCFFRQGRIYCRDDYHRAFSVDCSGCGNKIGSTELVMKAKHLIFHMKCFTCRICHRLLTKGDHYGIEDDMVLCKAHLALPNPMKNKTGVGRVHMMLMQHQGNAGILDTSSTVPSSPPSQLLLGPDQQANQLHQQLIHHQHLVGCDSFVSSGGVAAGMFPNNDGSSSRGLGPSSSELNIPVMNRHHQHQQQLGPASVMPIISADHQSVMLLAGHQQLQLQQQQEPFQSAMVSSASAAGDGHHHQVPAPSSQQQRTTGKGRSKKGRSKQQQQQQRMELLEVQNNMDMMGDPMDGLVYDPNHAHNGMMMAGPNCGEDGQGQMSGAQRAKRMRTSFKHHQLRTMKSYFALNQNPDAKDLRQLAQKTNLSKRVLQVWFQNARAKWRRSLQRQQEQSQTSNGQHDPLRNCGTSSGLTGDIVGSNSSNASNLSLPAQDSSSGMIETMAAGICPLPPMVDVHDNASMLSESVLGEDTDMALDLHGLPDMYMG